ISAISIVHACNTANRRLDRKRAKFVSILSAGFPFPSTGMRVQVPPRAPSCCLRGNPKSRVRSSMDEVIGHAGDRKNEGSFRINFFHPNGLVAEAKERAMH